jgi:hypothetical protein
MRRKALASGVTVTALGVRGETNSLTDSGVAGVNLNPNGSGAGVFGATVGRGPAGFFQGDVTVTGNLNVNGNITANGDIFLPGADLAEHFDMAESPKRLPLTEKRGRRSQRANGCSDYSACDSRDALHREPPKVLELSGRSHRYL